jgi:DNA primase catalytic core
VSLLPQSFIDEAKARVPLSQLLSLVWDSQKSNPKRGDYWACCPFHSEKSASFHVDDGKGFYHCFGCKVSGDHFKYLEEAKGLTFFEAAQELAKRAGLQMPAADPQALAKEERRKSLREALEVATEWFAKTLWDDKAGIMGRAYLATRNVPEDQARAFGLGLAPAQGGLIAILRERKIGHELALEAGLTGRNEADGFTYERFRGRLMFPIRDRLGRLVGFAGRDLEDHKDRAKYLNSPETPLFDKGSILWNADRARELVKISGRAVLAEGYFDVMALERAGFAAVAPMGTAISDLQLEGLWRLSPDAIVCLDGDDAGEKAAARLATLALPHAAPGRSLRFVTLGEGKDPDQWINSYGGEGLSQQLRGGVPLSEMVWRGLVAEAKVDTPEGRAALATAVAEACSAIADDAARGAYEGEFAGRLRSLWKERKVTAAIVKFDRKKKRDKATSEFSDHGAILDKMNRDYALVMLGQKAVVIADNPVDAAHSMERFRIYSLDGFSAWMRPRRVMEGGRLQNYADWWLQHKERRQFRGVEFYPLAPGEAARPNSYYNLWRGYDIDPCADDSLAAPWLDHISEVVCGGNAHVAEWVIAWFASLIQFPRERFGTSLVMRGKEGAGKTIAGNIVGSLFPASYFLIDSGRYLTGQFNAHMAACLLLQADEGFWAGDKAAEGQLKGLITSSFNMIEMKGVDPIRLPNFVHLLISSNEDWVVPVGPEARRYCVVDVAAHRIGDQAYFRDLVELYKRPEAKAALLHALMNWKIDRAALRRIPATDALFAQKIRSFDPAQSFIFEFLARGGFTDGGSWPQWVARSDFHQAYLKRCERYGARHPLGEASFGSAVARLMKGVMPARVREGDKRRHVHRLPGLEVARLDFENVVGHKIDWGEETPEFEGEVHAGLD